MEPTRPIRRPRIVHVITRYLRGGSEQRIRDIVRSFPEGRHHVLVGRDSDVGLVRRDLDPDVVTVLDALVREPDPVRDLTALLDIARLLRRHRFDLVVTHQSKAGVLGRAACWITRGPPAIHSLSMANFGPGYPGWQGRCFREIESRLERVTSAYAVVGHDLAARYAAIGIPEHKLVVVRSGVRLPVGTSRGAAREHVRRRLGLPSRRPIVAYVGSLEPRKNALDLVPFLDGLIHLEPCELRPFLAVAGEGPQRELLASALRSSGLAEDASLLGYISAPCDLIAAADALVLLSSAEGVSQVLVQASSLATPFIAYDVDGVRELLAMGAHGTVVPLGNVDDAAKAAALTLASHDDHPGSMDLTSWNPACIESQHRRLIQWAIGPRSMAAPSRVA